MENEVKEPAPKYGYISPAEYFEMEEESDEMLEYYDGFIVNMQGATISHGRITINLISNIHGYLEGKRCEMYASSVKIYAKERNSYVYPDATIFCDQIEFHDEKRSIVTNPSVVIEIMSQSNGMNDLTYKFLIYESIPSLKEYILIDSKKRWVKIVRKEGDGLWATQTLTQFNDVLHIRTIDLSISFDELYRNTLLKISA